MAYAHIMLDLETLDLGPRATILSIGACEIAPKAKRETFYMVVPKLGQETRTTSPSTLNWWSQQNDEAKKVLAEHSTTTHTLAAVLEQFNEYCMSLITNQEEGVCIWSKGASFDIPILGSLLEEQGRKKPWLYHKEYCYRTMASLRPHIKATSNDKEVAHHALDDAIYQARHLEALLSPKEFEALAMSR